MSSPSGEVACSPLSPSKNLTSEPEPAAASIPKFLIRNKRTGLYLTARFSHTINGPKAVLWTLHARPTQQWFIESTGHITNVGNELVLALKKNEGPEVVLATKDAAEIAQQWNVNLPSIVSCKTGQVLHSAQHALDAKSRLETSPPTSLPVPTPLLAKPLKTSEWELINITSTPFSAYVHTPTALPLNQVTERMEAIDITDVKEASISTMYYTSPSKSTATSSSSPSSATTSVFGGVKYEIPSMYFSWLSYQNAIDPADIDNEEVTKLGGYFHGNKYDAKTDSRLFGFGEWKIVNEYHYEYDKFNTHGLVAENSQDGVVIFAFRGTERDFGLKRASSSFNDWLFNSFNFMQEPYKKQKEWYGKLHLGFLDSYKSLRSLKFRHQVMEYFLAGYKIIFTGHSKGAAIATIAIYDSLVYLSRRVKEGKQPLLYARVQSTNYKDQFGLITFGSPKVGDKIFTDYFSRVVPKQNIRHFIAGYPFSIEISDCVTLVPIGNGYEHVHGDRFYIKANEKYFGNQHAQIKGVPYTYNPTIYALTINCHWQEVYMDGLLHEEIATKPFITSSLIEGISELTRVGSMNWKFFENQQKEFWSGLKAKFSFTSSNPDP